MSAAAIQSRGRGNVLPFRPARAVQCEPERNVGPVLRREDAGEAPLRLTARGRWVFTMLVTLMIVGLGLMGNRAAADGMVRGLEVQSYIVQPGDTLWQLASDLAAPGVDVRDVILELQELNELPRADLTAGQRLVLPLET